MLRGGGSIIKKEKSDDRFDTAGEFLVYGAPAPIRGVKCKALIRAYMYQGAWWGETSQHGTRTTGRWPDGRTGWRRRAATCTCGTRCEQCRRSQRTVSEEFLCTGMDRTPRPARSLCDAGSKGALASTLDVKRRMPSERSQRGRTRPSRTHTSVAGCSTSRPNAMDRSLATG